MRFITTFTHGIMDYALGALLIALPWLLGFAHIQAAMLIMVVLGAGMIVASLFTDYELGAIRMIPMPVHLGADALAGVFLAASPWIFGFADMIWIPHVILGVGALLGAACSQTEPSHGGISGTRTPRTRSRRVAQH